MRVSSHCEDYHERLAMRRMYDCKILTGDSILMATKKALDVKYSVTYDGQIDVVGASIEHPQRDDESRKFDAHVNLLFDKDRCSKLNFEMKVSPDMLLCDFKRDVCRKLVEMEIGSAISALSVQKSDGHWVVLGSGYDNYDAALDDMTLRCSLGFADHHVSIGYLCETGVVLQMVCAVCGVGVRR